MQSNELLKSMDIAAIEAHPNEACGLIVNVGKKAILMVCKNTSPEPTSQFVIDPQDYAKAEDLGEITGIWHSHTDAPATPSAADKAGCEASELPWLITSIYKNDEEIRICPPLLLEPSEFEMDYIGRPYIFGIFDCYSLVRDFYKRELGIEMKSFHDRRVDHWWQKGLDYFTDCANNEGGAKDFIEILDGSYIDKDILLFNINSEVPNHIAIYMENDTILHHMQSRLSRRESYGISWSKHKTKHYRHISKC